MSERGRYRRIYPRVWKHPGFVSLSDGERVLMLYLLTGPQTNRIGLYSLSVATAAEDLRSVPETIKKRLSKVCTSFNWHFDADVRVLYIPTWWHWNPPENANVLKGNLKDLSEIPPCALVDAFARNTGPLPETFHETFLQGLQQRLPGRLLNQKQYQEQEQKQEQALRQIPMDESNNEKCDELSPRDLELARVTLRLTGANSPTEELIDAFLNFALYEGHKTTRKRGVKALILARPSLQPMV